MASKGVAHYNGYVLNANDPIVDFRGKTHLFKEVTRLPEQGRSAKVLTDCGIDYYSTVFPGLEIREVE